MPWSNYAEPEAPEIPTPPRCAYCGATSDLEPCVIQRGTREHPVFEAAFRCRDRHCKPKENRK